MIVFNPVILAFFTTTKPLVVYVMSSLSMV